MNTVLENFIAQTRRVHAGGMKTLENLMERKPSARDWVDSCVVGGATLEDIINGEVTDADIDPEVIEAFHLQYPNLGSFVDKVQELDGDPDAIRGLVSGVKGKLFETKFVDMLNDEGFLPSGLTAVLADSPTQSGWDVVIVGPYGDHLEQWQLKATESASYVREALERYPEFEVVVPTDVFPELVQHSDLAGHIIDSGIHSEQILEPVATGIEEAVSVAGPDLVPELAFLFIGASALYSISRGKDKREVFKDAGNRIKKAAVAGGLGGLATFAIDPFVGLPVSLLARLVMSKRQLNAEIAEGVEVRIQRVERIKNLVDRRPANGKVRYLQPQQVLLLTE